jgi:hypothetical protein
MPIYWRWARARPAWCGSDTESSRHGHARVDSAGLSTRRIPVRRSLALPTAWGGASHARSGPNPSDLQPGCRAQTSRDRHRSRPTERGSTPLRLAAERRSRAGLGCCRVVTCLWAWSIAKAGLLAASGVAGTVRRPERSHRLRRRPRCPRASGICPCTERPAALRPRAWCKWRGRGSEQRH